MDEDKDYIELVEQARLGTKGRVLIPRRNRFESGCMPVYMRIPDRNPLKKSLKTSEKMKNRLLKKYISCIMHNYYVSERPSRPLKLF